MSGTPTTANERPTAARPSTGERLAEYFTLRKAAAELERLDEVSRARIAESIALARQHEGRDQHREEPEAEHEMPGQRRAERAVHQHLAAEHGVQRDIQQQAGQHRRDGRRSLGVGVRQPAVHRGQACLGGEAEDGQGYGDPGQVGVQGEPAVGPSRPTRRS